MPSPAFVRLLFAAIVCAAAFSLTGCATQDPDRESDMPWNMPQSWEGAPSIPGMSQ